MEAAPAAAVGVAAVPASTTLLPDGRIYRNMSLVILNSSPEYVNWHPDPDRNREWAQKVPVARNRRLSYSIPRPGTPFDWQYIGGCHTIIHDIGRRMWKDRRGQIHMKLIP